jgi:hypothetical protein
MDNSAHPIGSYHMARSQKSPPTEAPTLRFFCRLPVILPTTSFRLPPTTKTNQLPPLSIKQSKTYLPSRPIHTYSHASPEVCRPCSRVPRTCAPDHHLFLHNSSAAASRHDDGCSSSARRSSCSARSCAASFPGPWSVRPDGQHRCVRFPPPCFFLPLFLSVGKAKLCLNP